MDLVVALAAVAFVWVLLLVLVRIVQIFVHLREIPGPPGIGFSSAFASFLRLLSTAFFFAIRAVRASLAEWLIEVFAMCSVHRRERVYFEHMHMTVCLSLILRGPCQVPKPIFSRRDTTCSYTAVPAQQSKPQLAAFVRPFRHAGEFGWMNWSI